MSVKSRGGLVSLAECRSGIIRWVDAIGTVDRPGWAGPFSGYAVQRSVIFMSRRNLFWLLGIAAVSLFGMAVSHSAPTLEKDKDYELVRLLVDVLHEVRHKYVVDVSPERE